MSKKTRKKSSKSPPKSAGGKPKAAKRLATKAAAGQSAKKTAAKRPAAKALASRTVAAKAAKKTPAKTPKPVGKSAPVLSEGQSAPAFSLPRDGGQTVSLANYAGRKLVIFFYPRADTPGCTLEAIAFSRLADEFADAGTAVLGVSADSVTKQETFRDKHDLTVPLVSDETLGMLKAYGVWGEKSLYGKTFMGIVRTTVLVDADGRIARIWRTVRVDGHADAVLDAARAL
ncbi:peroxiredoxin [Afipia clevelandensis]|uniref:thioredoxin-dependent peroxiredoxin n=1 Tax=Afipia clevelandensis ATCC 49720 TaxID=883079 RepID=K8PNY9_9BRAD|nr:peroxiredoxin [Afipia clevelandensis]EKS40088.1 hypothetical protein HMPREF9696_01100 [Afipia clevelandensis ATCC 49720]